MQLGMIGLGRMGANLDAVDRAKEQIGGSPGSWGPDSMNQLIAPWRWHLPEDGR